MIRLLGVSEEPAFIKAVHTPEIGIYDIMSAYLGDEDEFHRNYALGNETMLWIDREGRFAEIEALVPARTETALCQYAPTLTTRVGIPRLEVLSKEFNVHAQLHPPGFTLWVVQDKVIDLRIDVHSGDISFLFAGTEFVGITAHTPIIAE